jgi:HEPN domain-containing protein
MPHDPALVAEVRGWLSKAGKDLATAQYELQADPPFSEDIVFHSQQAAEKHVSQTWGAIQSGYVPSVPGLVQVWFKFANLICLDIISIF